MTVFNFVTLTDAVLAFKKPWNYILARQLRDNINATAQGASGAQPIAHQALSYQDFTASGTFVVPDYVNKVYVELVGAGGGGASSTTSGYQTGGAAGGRARGWCTVTPGASITVTVGAGGTGASIGNDNATSGGTSSFGSLISATGGTRGRAQPSPINFDAFYAIQLAARGGNGVGVGDNYQGSAGMINDANSNGFAYGEGGRGIGGIGGNGTAAAGTFAGEGGRSGGWSSGTAGFNGARGFVRVWF